MDLMQFYSEPYNEVYNDLKVLKRLVEHTKIQEIGVVADTFWVRMLCFQPMPISLLEYFLKKTKQKRQRDIPEVIRSSEKLSKKEKDHLILFFLMRHCIVHNGGRVDDDFIKKITDYELKYLCKYNVGDIVLQPKKNIVMIIDIVQKLITEI